MANDITAILYSIKENIKIVESREFDNSLLVDIRTDFLELIELIKLFLISERDSYYGYFLMNMQFSANFNSNSIACIKLNTFPPVFEANPLLLCKFTLKEIIFIVCHEIDHVVLNHPAEMVKTNPLNNPTTAQEFNLAADAAVNDRINYEIKKEKHSFMSPPEGLITSSSLGEKFRIKNIKQMENYAYYFDLIAGKIDSTSTGGNTLNGQESIMQSNSDDESNGIGSNDNGEEGQIVTANNCKELVDHNWDAGEDFEDATAVTKEFVNAAVDMMNDETRGMMPRSFLSDVEKLNKPPVLSWQAILKKYVGTIAANKRKTRTRLNRRQPERFDLSGSMDDKVLKIVVAIDTSASVSNDMISKIMNEIFEILSKRKHEITIIECDAEVQRVYRVRSISEVKSKVQGRGGTSFGPVIEYVNNDKYFRDALLIYFTDGYGELSIPKPLTYRNIWVVIGDERNLSVEEPYGAVLAL